MGGGCIKIAGYMINALSAVIALEYISHGFEKKYKDFRGIVLFLGGCAVYFMTVTLLNHFTHFEGFLVSLLSGCTGRKKSRFFSSQLDMGINCGYQCVCDVCRAWNDNE